MFRAKDLYLVNIDRASFINDKEYYSYIKKIMSGDNRNDLPSTSLVDTLVDLVNKHGVGRIANKNN